MILFIGKKKKTLSIVHTWDLKTLTRIDNLEMSPWLFRSAMSPPLSKDRTNADFYTEGISFMSSQRLKKDVSNAEK